MLTSAHKQLAFSHNEPLCVDDSSADTQVD